LTGKLRGIFAFAILIEARTVFAASDRWRKAALSRAHARAILVRSESEASLHPEVPRSPISTQSGHLGKVLPRRSRL